MKGPTAQQVRERINKAYELLSKGLPTDAVDLRLVSVKRHLELWAIMSDIQLWMQDIEEKLDTRRQR